VPPGIHPFVQDTNDLKDPPLARAIVDHVHRLPHALGFPFASRMSHVEASKTRPHVAPLPRERAVGLPGQLLYRVEQQNRVSSPSLATPLLGADRENPSEISLCRSGEPKSSH
jgi:hypothetical protein